MWLSRYHISLLKLSNKYQLKTAAFLRSNGLERAAFICWPVSGRKIEHRGGDFRYKLIYSDMFEL
ncbi:hypothetical protein B0X71_09670 [Planococcus lenghuensis]|uniref:Uncharacterized protein n=1 Tax=Planococcus lenghuensis TaxID=2213202 RepID=A0A1Q2KYP9_9BACL|nr:hypothetical protein B0X71_09670 [Planococcus lenghuensis]